jgi:hypothetical protein
MPTMPTCQYHLRAHIIYISPYNNDRSRTSATVMMGFKDHVALHGSDLAAETATQTNHDMAAVDRT